MSLRGRYRPLACIGEGSFGRTFLAVDEDLPSKPRCMIKQLRGDLSSGGGDGVDGSANVARVAETLFRREAVQLERLDHPQIPKLLAFCEDNSCKFLVETFISGKSLLLELVERGGEPFSPRQVADCMDEMLRILVVCA